MAVYPNTSNFTPSTVTDLSLKYDNDVTFSTVPGGIFSEEENDNINVYLFKAYNFSIPEQVSVVQWDFRKFKDVPNGYVQEISDPNNNFQNIYNGSDIIDRAFIAPYDGVFKFEIKDGGHITGNDVIQKKGGFLSFKLVSYPSHSIQSDGTYDGTKEVLYETPLTPLIFTSSRYNYELNPQSNNQLFDYLDTGDFGLAVGGALLPFNNLLKDATKLYSGSGTYGSDGTSHYLAKVPRSGSYGFDVKIEGSANITTTVTTPSGFQGTFTTPNKTVTATLVIKKRDSETLSLSDEYTETKTITVGGVSINDPNPGDSVFTDTRNFDLNSIFDTTDINIELDENDSALAYIKLETPNGSATQTFSETINGISGFSLQLTNNFFRLKDSSFFKLNSYTPEDTDGQYINFLINEKDISLSLTEGDAVTVHGKVQHIVSQSTTLPNSYIEGVTLPGLSITDVHVTTNNFFKVTKAVDNPISSGEYLGQVNADGRDFYQPLEGSFIVDVSDIQASITHPVLVTVPLHGFTKYVNLPLQETKQFNRPNNRRFLNNSIEVQLSTFSNKDQGLFSSGRLFPTHEVLQANFMHLSRNNFATTHNSALISRFDEFGNGYTSADLIENYPYLNGLPSFVFDDIVNVTGSINNIYEGGPAPGMPDGALITPQIFLTVGQDSFGLENNDVVVFADNSFNANQEQFFDSIDYPIGGSPLNSTTEAAPGQFGWFKNYNYYTGSYAYDNSNVVGSAQYKVTKDGFLNLDSASFQGNYFTTVEGTAVAYPRTPTSLPIYFDRVIHDPNNNYNTSSESPAQNTTVPQGTNSPSLPDKSTYGNLRGPDVYPFVRNYYEAPEDGFYTVAYNLNLIAEAAGGYGGVAGLSGKDISRFLNFNMNVANPSSPSPLAYSALYDYHPIMPFKQNGSANTLYGKIVRVSTTSDSPGAIQAPQTITTSSLFRTDDFVDTRVNPITIDYYGVPIGIGTAYVNNDDVSISMVSLGTTPDQDVFITNTGLIQNTQDLPNTNIIWESHYSSAPTLNPQYDASDFNSDSLYQSYLNSLNPQSTYNDEHSLIRWFYSGQCQELYFYNENNQLDVATYEDFFGTETLEPTTYQQNFLETLMNQLNLSPEEILYGLQQGFSNLLGNNTFSTDDNGLTLTLADGTVIYQNLGNGNFYSENPSLINVNSLLSGLENWNLEISDGLEIDGVIIDGSNGFDTNETNAIVNAINDKLALYAWSFRTPGTGITNSLLLPDMIFGSQYASSSPSAENYPPERVSLPINDKKAIYLHKGDRIHIEVGLGPILPANSYDWSDAEDLSGNTGQYSKLSSVGRIYVGPESFMSVSQIKGGAELQPHLQFVMTGNNSDTIVKGTYKYF